MPKLPRGMFKRGPTYYTRDQRGYGHRWTNLGRDLAEATERLKYFRANRHRILSHISVAAAADQWLELRIAAPGGRNEKGQKEARSVVERYLKPALGQILLSRLAPTHVARYANSVKERC